MESFKLFSEFLAVLSKILFNRHLTENLHNMEIYYKMFLCSNLFQLSNEIQRRVVWYDQLKSRQYEDLW